MNQFIEHAVEADADGEGAFPGLDVDVAGVGLDGVDEEVIDQRGISMPFWSETDCK